MNKTLIAAALALAFAAAATAAPITYSVSRTIGGGTVVGTVETDGTLGLLSGANFLSWSVTLSSPNMTNGGETISGTTAFAGGTGLFATLTELTFDFDVAGNSFFFVQGASGNAWCMTAGPISCAGETPPAEGIFFSATGGPAEAVTRTGTHVLATAVSVVPEPATLALVGLALAAGGLARRRVAA